MTAWAGLGYYARARNLHGLRRRIASEHGGRFPDTEAGLARPARHRRLYGGGDRGDRLRRAGRVVDGNVERVMARLFAVEVPLPDAKPEISGWRRRSTPRDRAGD